MTSHASTLADPGSQASATEQDLTLPDDALTQPGDFLALGGDSELTPVDPMSRTAAAQEGHLDGSIVEEITNRLPTPELVKIIKSALECGRRNVPFTESDLLRAMTFGATSVPARQPARGPRAPR